MYLLTPNHPKPPWHGLLGGGGLTAGGGGGAPCTLCSSLTRARAPTRYYPGASPCGFVENLIKVIKHQAGRVHRVSRFGICCQVLRGPPHVHGPLPPALSLWPASIYTSLGLSPSEPELLM